MPHVREYYERFSGTYPGVGAWHKRLMDEAVSQKRIRLPDGKEFAFPFARRLSSGGISDATKVKNYPVQYFATGCIVPLSLLLLREKLHLYDKKSVIINTVHDSGVLDRHPDDDREELVRLIFEAATEVPAEMERRFGHRLTIPLAIEVKAGPNWLDGDVVNCLRKAA
jgi:DNA polymerase I-like protein with 3'-5' exonuclease and polymerase domains